MAAQPKLITYRDYRAFLLDYFTWKKASRPGYSWRRLAEMAGLHSPNYLNLVVHKKRNLTEENALQVAKALGLDADEAHFFGALVTLDRAADPTARQAVEVQIAAMLQRFTRTRLAGAQLDLLKAWPTFVVLEALRLEGVRTDPDSLVKLMQNRVSLEEVERSLRSLATNGLIEEHDGRLRPTSDAEVSAYYHQNPGLARTYFGECLEAWKGILPGVSASEGTFRVVTLPSNLACIDELKAKIRTFQDELVVWIEAQSGKDRVVQLCMLCLPVTMGIGEAGPDFEASSAPSTPSLA